MYPRALYKLLQISDSNKTSLIKFLQIHNLITNYPILIRKIKEKNKIKIYLGGIFLLGKHYVLSETNVPFPYPQHHTTNKGRVSNIRINR